MKELFDILVEKANLTVDYFESHLTKKGSLGEQVTDLAAYYKLPMLLITAGKKTHALNVLKYIESKFMNESGDFLTKDGLKSIKPEYNDYWCYQNSWLVRAAQRLKQEALFNRGYNYLSLSYLENKSGFYTNNFGANNQITDVFTASYHGLISLERKNINVSLAAGDYLCEAINRQPNLDEIFYLRFDEKLEPIIKFDDEKSVFYAVKKTHEEQLYFMIGYPSAYLALLYQETNNEKYLSAAKAYLDFALTCHENIFKSDFSHKIAWAASIIYPLTREKKYLSAIEKITSHFISKQSDNGMWYPDQDLNTSYDQSAEIACWFLEIADNLRKYKKVHDNEIKNGNSPSYISKVMKYGVVALLVSVGLYALHPYLSKKKYADIDKNGNPQMKF